MKWIVLGVLCRDTGAHGPAAVTAEVLVHACYFMGLLVFFFDPYLNVGQ